MFYSALINKNGSLGKWKKIDKPTLEEAKEWVKSYIQFKDSKKKLSNYKIISEADYNLMIANEEKMKQDYLTLDERAQFVWENIIKEEVREYPELTTDLIGKFCLKNGTDKAYYIICSWNTDCSGSFNSLEDLKDVFKEKAEAGDDWFDIIVYDAKTGDQLDIKAQFNIKLYLNGKEII
jgi:hypothetical protein